MFNIIKERFKRTMPTKIIVGLGNPGAQYVQTRHNAGFLTIDALADELRANYWKSEAGAETAKVKFQEEEILLVRPLTFMNRSGSSVKQLVDKYKIDPTKDLIVIADELDLPEGETRVKVGGGHAGHNGHRSIIEKLGTRDYKRIRVGIGRPPGKMDAADYVLQPLRAQAFEELQVTARHAADITLKET
jgi:PTH1 family peptidyl-tRNA hydrolase